MGEIVTSTYISLDGVIDHPETWPSTGGFQEEGNRIQTELVRDCAAILMGRHTYEGFAPVWSTMSDNALADRMNALPKYVASTTLTNPTWNNTHVVTDNLATAVAELKDQLDGDIVQFGFGDVTRTLVAAGLLDRVRLWLHPFILGRGGPKGLLYRDVPVTQLDLEAVARLTSGIVVLDYRVRRES